MADGARKAASPTSGLGCWSRTSSIGRLPCRRVACLAFRNAGAMGQRRSESRDRLAHRAVGTARRVRSLPGHLIDGGDRDGANGRTAQRKPTGNRRESVQSTRGDAPADRTHPFLRRGRWRHLLVPHAGPGDAARISARTHRAVQQRPETRGGKNVPGADPQKAILVDRRRGPSRRPALGHDRRAGPMVPGRNRGRP